MAGAGIYRATVTAVGSSTLSLQIPNLTFAYVYTDVPFYGNKPSVNDEIIVGFLNGEAGNPVAIIPGGASAPSSSAQGDIDGVTAGLGLSGGGTSGTVSLAFAPSELSSVTVATDDKVVIADTSDSDNPKHVTAQSIADLAPQGDITGVTAGLGIGGGGTTGTVEVTFAPSELSSVTVATDDKVVIADTSDSDNPKHVTAQSIADLASVSPAGSDTQVQFNNSGSFGASSNMVFDGTNLDIAGLKLGGTAVTSTATEINLLDGVTAGTISASKAVVADSNSDVATTGDLTAKTGGADSGIVLGQAFGSGYVGLRTAGMAEDSSDEYVIMSNGNHTFISAGGGTGNTEGDVYIRAGGNSTSCQIFLDTSENEINIDGELKTDDPITSTDLISTTSVIQANEFRASDYGPASDSSFTFVSDENLGMYRVGADALGLSANGLKFEVKSAYIRWHAALPVVSSYSTLRSGTSGGVTKVVGYDGSSQRYKENITNFVKSDWENIYNLQAVRFTWKEEVAADKHASWGLISEDVYAQIPELGVMRVVEGVNDGNPVPDTVNYEQLCVFLIEAVKDLNTRLAALE